MIKRAFACGFLVLTLPGCLDTSPLEGRPTAVDIVADRSTAEVGETVNFAVRAEGTALAGVVIRFGDGAVDSTFTAGARTVELDRDHAYGEAGSFAVEARAEEGNGTAVTDVVQVEIVAAGGG